MGFRATVVAVCMVAACARAARTTQPSPSLSQTPAAAAAFLPIHEAWEARHPDRAAIEQFLVRFPEDGAAPLARVYLTFLDIDAQSLADADTMLATLTELPPGTTHDLATVARARSLRLHGAPASALDLLRPLVGKIVDEADREVFLEEVALSALAAHDDYEAVGYLDAWLRGVGEDDKDRVRNRIEALVETLPRPVLEETYKSMRAAGASSGYGEGMEKVIAERLARIAVQANDPALARWLVEQSGVSAAQTGGDAGVELGELATSKRGLASFAGHTVGLLIPTHDPELRDESADVISGLSFALGLPRADGAPEDVRLVTRDDGVDDAATSAALEELMGEGAAVVIGGFDQDDADRASRWSEAHGLPVLLLNTPSAAAWPKKNAIVLGESADREVALLGEELTKRKVKTSAFVTATSDDEAAAKSSPVPLLPAVHCDIPLADAGHTRFPVDAWWAQGARGVLVAGDAFCARDVLRDLGAHPLTVALTLESGVPLREVPKGVNVVVASAGSIPILADKADDVADPEIRRFMGALGVRPSWWTALGHDAGVLAKSAVDGLPRDTTRDPTVIAQRRALVQAGLLATKGKLWTTDEPNVATTRVLGRTVRVEPAKAPSR